MDELKYRIPVVPDAWGRQLRLTSALGMELTPAMYGTAATMMYCSLVLRYGAIG